MAQTSTDNFMDDLKDYFQALLVGSFTFGSVFPLVFRTVSDLFPTTESSTVGQVWLFYAVNVVYFIGPLILGCLVWWWLKKTNADDLLFKEDFLSFQNEDRKQTWQRWLQYTPVGILVVLISIGLLVMRALGDPFHGSKFIGLLFLLHLVITLVTARLSWFSFNQLIWQPNKNVPYFKRFVSRIRTQWLVGLLLSSGLFAAATFSFFYEHEGTYLWNVVFRKTAPPRDASLSIEMPFKWEKTAHKIDNSLVKPFNACFANVATEASLLDATQLDYNDIAIRVNPTPAQKPILSKALPLKYADSLRSLILTTYQTLHELTGYGPQLRYTNSDSLDAYLDKITRSKQVSLMQSYYCLNLDSIRQSTQLSDTLFTTTMQLLRANQLMPLADNLSEAAEIIRQNADTQSRSLLAQWVKISRIKGLFFLSTFLNLLLCAWFVIRLANEALIRSKKTGRSAKPENQPKQYRELANLRHYISLTVLLILPLFRTVDETTVNSDRPYWFLNLPELVGNVVQPLPNNDAANSAGQFGQNEVTNRLDEINKQVRSLNNTAKKLEQVSGNTRSELNDMRY